MVEPPHDEVAARPGSIPPPPKSLRSLRYRGDDRAVRLSELPAEDRDAVRALYDALRPLHAALSTRETREGEASALAAATGFDVDLALRTARALGRDGGALSIEQRRALHDVRGGALTSLLVELQRFRLRAPADPARALAAFEVLSSDQLKIMRNAILELDDPRREADLAPCPHLVSRLADSLSRVTGERPDGPVRVEVDCAFTGAITMSCVELGALDRATLNLVNNAVRHAAGPVVSVWLSPVPGADDPDLRVVVSNRVDAAQARALEERFGAELGRLFVEAFTTTGSGEGLKISLDFVAAAYGFARPAEAVTSRVVGAAVVDGWFSAWLHWPAVV